METAVTRTFKLTVAYNGARFKGWQRGNGRTVQSTLEDAIRQSIPAGTAVSVDGSGRTDAGVHAEGQVASVVLPASVDPEHLLETVNRLLPSDLALRSVEPAHDRFHARYLATGKTYRYRIVDGPVGDPFLHRLSWRRPGELDVERMTVGARRLTGTHDFGAFTADRSKSNTVRTVRAIRFERTPMNGGRPLEILVHGDGFLWKQVRIMVAALVAVGSREIDVPDVERMVASGDRSLAPAPAPACGLTLVSVEYDGPSVRS